MAAGFLEGKRCQGVGCKEDTSVLYNVKEKQMLCDRCAHAKESAVKDRQNWSCETHAKNILFYCETHDAGICQSCATVRHRGACSLHDIDDIITERRMALRDLAARIPGALASCRKQAESIAQRKPNATQHLLSLEDEVRQITEAALEKEDAEQQKKGNRINKEADEEISKVNIKRDERMKQSRDDSLKKKQEIKNQDTELLNELRDINNQVVARMDKLEQQARKSQLVINKCLREVENLLLDNQAIVEAGKQVLPSLTNTIGSRIAGDEVEEIVRKIEGVRLVKCEGAEGYKGRVEWPGGKWELADSIQITEDVKIPIIAGCISEDELVISDRSFDNAHAFVTNIRTKTTEIVAETDSETFIASCARLPGGEVVCGNRQRGCHGNTLSRCIKVFDSEWRFLRNLDIPRNMENDYARVEIAVDRRSGLLLACEAGQSIIYVIDPDNGKVLRTTTCQSGDMLRMRGVLASGDIVARRAPFDNALLLVAPDGRQKELFHTETVWHAAVDSLTGALYVVCYDADKNSCAIARMPCEGRGEAASREVSFSLSGQLDTRNERLWHVVSSDVIITPRGRLVVCDGRNVLVYVKKFRL